MTTSFQIFSNGFGNEMLLRFFIFTVFDTKPVSEEV